MLGLDLSTPLSKQDFQQTLLKAQDDRVLATWIVCDLNHYARVNPEYDDVYQQYRDEAKIARSTVDKYNATIEAFPIRRRKWNLSIDLYYTVTSLRLEDGSPAEYVQDNLLSRVVRMNDTGAIPEGGVRKWLRDEVKKLKREPIIEREKVTGKVGSIDDMLLNWHKLPEGYEVEIVITKQQAYEQSELETETEAAA